MSDQFDLVIRDGQVADGLGTRLVQADVAVNGDRIVEVGSFSGTGKRETIEMAKPPAAPG